MQATQVFIVSDIHYAAEAERQRGLTELKVIRNPVARGFVKCYRRYIWRRDPFGQNHLLDRFIQLAGAADFVIANGDYSCDTAFIGVSDGPSRDSARQCLTKLRQAFGERLRATLGDHELGKVSLFGGCGGMRLESWHRSLQDLQLEPFWQLALGKYVLLGVASSVLALPIFEPELLDSERAEWRQIRDDHLDALRKSMARLTTGQRIILFCHDPTALPFLWEDAAIRSKLDRLELTIIGHLHSPLFLWKARLLAGLPTIRLFGHSIRRMSTALGKARLWRHFNVKLCPALGGIELLKDGGYGRLIIGAEGNRNLQFDRVPLPRR